MTPAELTAARKSLGLTQKAFAAWLRCGREHLSDMERGAVNITEATAELVRAYLAGYRPS